jgi:hypothetical protein
MNNFTERTKNGENKKCTCKGTNGKNRKEHALRCESDKQHSPDDIFLERLL